MKTNKYSLNIFYGTKTLPYFHILICGRRCEALAFTT